MNISVNIIKYETTSRTQRTQDEISRPGETLTVISAASSSYVCKPQTYIQSNRLQVNLTHGISCMNH